MIISKPSQVALQSVHIYGAILRRTTDHKGNNKRHYAGVEVLGRLRFIRISKAKYDQLNSTCKVKCAFTTNTLKDTVQYQHSIGF